MSKKYNELNKMMNNMFQFLNSKKYKYNSIALLCEFAHSLAQLLERPVEATLAVHVLPVLPRLLHCGCPLSRSSVIVLDLLVLSSLEPAEAHQPRHGGLLALVLVDSILHRSVVVVAVAREKGTERGGGEEGRERETKKRDREMYVDALIQKEREVLFRVKKREEEGERKKEEERTQETLWTNRQVRL